MQNIKRNFKEKLKILIDVFNIPLQEKWKKHLKDDHYNFFLYFDGCSLVEKDKFIYGKPETYKLAYNKFIERYFYKNEFYFETKDLTGKFIADVGCGWGILSLWYALSGAEKVYAIGFPYQTEFIDKLISRAKEKKIIDSSINIQAIAKPIEKGNFTIGSIEPGSIDRVYYNDVFEHLPDSIFNDALIGSYNMLKEGGKLISVTHNTDCIYIFKRVQEWWTKLENESFISYRTNAIKEKIPAISQDHLEEMVKGTRGLLTKDFNNAIDDYKIRGVIKRAHKLMPAVDLTIDYICENYISASSVVKMMQLVGFNADCYAALMHSRRYMILQPFALIFKSFFMNLGALNGAVVFIGKKK